MKSKSLLRFTFIVTIVLAMTITPSIGQDAATSIKFEPPVRLRANGQFIDTGPAWGHSAPCIEDLDGDGLDDLIVGDFGGKFRMYRNVGVANEPSPRGMRAMFSNLSPAPITTNSPRRVML